LQVGLSSKKKKILFASIIIIVIVFLTYISIQSFWADIHYRRAQRLSRSIKAWKQAAKEYEKAISISPGNSEYHDEAGKIYSRLAILYQDDDYFNKAVYHFKKSYQLNPYNAWAHYHLAWCYWNKKMYPDWQLASIYEQMGKLKEAAFEYSEVLRILPGHSKAKEAVKRVEEKIKKQE